MKCRYCKRKLRKEGGKWLDSTVNENVIGIDIEYQALCEERIRPDSTGYLHEPDKESVIGLILEAIDTQG